MELLYIWIKDYKNLKNVGFNLAGEDYFCFDGENITYTKKNNYISDFFDSKGNINVTAIIGENGTGKTNFFRFISQFSFPILTEFEGIVIFNNSGEKNIYHHKDIKVRFDTITGIKKIDTLKSKNIVNNYSVENSILQKRTKFVYISNILNPYFQDNFDYLNFDNSLKVYSKNSLLSKDIDHFNFFYKNENNLKFNVNSKFSSAFHYHNIMELFRQKELIVSDISKDLKKILGFNFPDSLACSTNNFYENYLFSLFKDSEDFTKIKKLSYLLKEGVEKLKNKYKEKQPKNTSNSTYGENSLNILKIDLFKTILFLEIYDIYILYNKSKKDISIDEKLYNFDFKDISSTMTFFTELSDNLRNEIDKSFPKSPLNSNIYLDVIDYLFKHIDNNENIFKETYIIFHKKDLNIFFQKLESLYSKDAFINIQWFNSENNDFNLLSNGENNILTILSRLYLASIEVRDYDEMYIMIDEGDLGLHPKWQKKFLRICLEVSKKIFKIDRKKFNFIFSSHSPFLLSDLPNYNVILLENNNGKVEVQKNTDLTFAGNIHTLYSKDFFIDEILIGDFAKEKIDSEIVKNLFINPSKDIGIKEKEKIKNIINLISEPILRNRFLDKFREVFDD